jgi:hypothetical protein
MKRTLRPHKGNEVDAVEGIEYEVQRKDGCISVEYDLYGALDHLVIPASTALEDKRCNELWLHTCFEIFLKEQGDLSSSYIECNFSPAGTWNIYRFSSYRKEMEPAELVRAPEITVVKTGKIFSLKAEIEIAGLISSASAIDVGVSCIVESRDGKLGHWALSHPGETADFHNPRAFEVRLSAEDAQQIH